MSIEPQLQPPRRRRRRGGRRKHNNPTAIVKPSHLGRYIFLIIVGFMLSGVAGAFTFFLPAIRTAIASTSKQASTKGGTGSSTVSVNENVPTPPPNQPFNVLLLGSDNDNKFTNNDYLTQSMILVRVDPTTDKVVMFSISRDLNVPLYSASDESLDDTDKIDKAYLLGGVQGAINTVENDFDVQVNYYIWIGLKGLVNLINQMGNVDVNVTNAVLDDDYPNDLGPGNPYEALRVAVLPGPQELNGLIAMEYVRSRHDDVREDLGRSVRQQQVLIALKAKEQFLTLTDVPSLSNAISGQVSTNMSIPFMVSLRSLAKSVSANSIQQIILFPPYAVGTVVGAQDVLQPNWDLILPYIHQYFPATS